MLGTHSKPRRGEIKFSNFNFNFNMLVTILSMSHVHETLGGLSASDSFHVWLSSLSLIQVFWLQ